MKKLVLLAFLVFQFTFAQQPYYNDVDLTLTGQDLYNALQMKISQHNQNFTYGDARDVLVFTDENPDNTSTVLLVFGYDDNDNNCTTDRSRNKAAFGGMVCEYNREHVFARSRSNPSMGSTNNNATGIIADPHNIRACDQQMNNNKGDRKLQDGSGNAAVLSTGNWYPGDEWKGDVARMMMYMYTRYGDQCLPSLMGVGTLQPGTQMLETYLQWNADDPVNEYEDQRNDFLQDAYGNRNPFIDNPALATIIWGGPVAEDRWGILSSQTISDFEFVLYPNPAMNQEVNIVTNTTVDNLVLYDINGRIILKMENPEIINNTITISDIPQGFYLMNVNSSKGSTTKKLVVN